MKKENPSTVAQTAPETTTPLVQQPAQQYSIERQGSRTVPVTRRWPQIRGGICEYCGVIDPKVRAEDQYKLCPHFRGLGQLRCSYCDESKNPDDVISHSVLNVAAHPDNPNKLIAWCNSYECSRKHEKRFKVSS